MRGLLVLVVCIELRSFTLVGDACTWLTVGCSDDDEIQGELVEEQEEEAPSRFPPSFRPHRV